MALSCRDKVAPNPLLAIIPRMKFFLAIAVYLLLSAALGWGILLAFHGNFWLLLVSLLLYILAFAKSCLPKPSH